MQAPLICQQCAAAYDTSSYPPGHRFECTCGQEIVLPAEGAAPPQKATSRLAVASLVLACLFCVPLAPLVGVLIGIVALVRISGRPLLGGEGYAIGGIAVGLFSFVFGTGILAAIAIPNFVRYTNRAKVAEAKSNLASVRLLEESYRVEYGEFLSAGPTPETIPLAEQVPFEPTDAWRELGFDPGMVRYQYQVVVDPNGDAMVYARGDLDGDGVSSELAYDLSDASDGELLLTDELE